ncbi:hypothetical protein C1T31_04725 [Hanstruepera neustonica]|uniref:Uncharacterized protein n=1 Tax=Hanstruepera neustonica TaxID=1445657 RepID=A0A2K1E040_9FLAO|nr:hypothetical protein [Hanstruepera neustonica]PNQ73646.1 hypothetical protein C1T31_04725 [Hanstruepera neustonica]
MKTKFHWKIIIAFVVLPILALTLFGFIYSLVIDSKEKPPTEVYIFMTIFGILGFWLLLTLLFRAKKIKFNDGNLTITRLFLFQKYSYAQSDIDHFQVLLKQENPFMAYEILQFKTKDNKYHSIVSYEFQHFRKITDWIHRTNAKQKEIGIMKFIKNEYGLSFIVALIIYIGLLYL